MYKIQNLDFLSDVLQVANFLMNVSQSSTDEIMTELQKQNDKYLKKIIEQNEEILDRLKEIKNV